MNEDNTHLLFLRGRGKSFWKKDKGEEKKERSGGENFKYTLLYAHKRKKTSPRVTEDY